MLYWLSLPSFRLQKRFLTQSLHHSGYCYKSSLLTVVTLSLAVLFATLLGCTMGVILMVSKYILMAIVFFLVTWILRMTFILAKYKGLPPIVERFLKFLTSFYYLCLDSSCCERKSRKLPQIKWLDFLCIPNSLVPFVTAIWWGPFSLEWSW